MMCVVVAPDSFKGSATATEAAEAIARGWRAVHPESAIAVVPMADGGEGTLEAFRAGAIVHPLTVVGPDGRDVDAEWLELADGAGVVELAVASGITLLDPLQPLDAHTYGFGQLIADALDFGVARLVLAIGGSSSTDGGTGALRALGARFLDSSGNEVVRGGRGLADLAQVDLGGLRRLPEGGVTILSDVTNPLLGARGAAAVFGPQKGANPEEVVALEAGLSRLADLAGADPAAAGAGAAGGTGYGLLLWGASIASGAQAVGDALNLGSRYVQGADLIITGEGRFDDQSADGKVPSYLLELGAASAVPVALVAGLIQAPTDAFEAAVSLTDLAAAENADPRADAPRWLELAGRTLAARYPA